MKFKLIMGTLLTVLLISMLTLAFNIQPVKADPETIYVDDDNTAGPWDGTPEHPYQDITSALQHASVNDTIYVYNGTYYERVDVNKTVSLIGENRDSTIITNPWYVFDVFADNVVISGFTLESEGFHVFIHEKTGVTVSGNLFINTESTEAMSIFGGSHNKIINNTVLGLTSDAGGIMMLYASTDNIIGGNNIVGGAMGVFLQSNCQHNLIANNTIRNTVTIPMGLGGAIMIDRCSYNTFYHNNFINNTRQVQILNAGYPNYLDNGYPSGGNYWSNYTGVDVKSGPNQDQPSSDGIGDTAYVIDDWNRDNYPLMYPWGASPPPSYTLTIYSSPSGVTFTVDNVSCTNPWSGTYSEGSSVSLVMPETHDRYFWSHWLEDGDHNRTKTVTMNTNVTLTAAYTSAPPVGGIYVPVNKLELLAPYIGLTILLAVAVTTVGYVKKRKRHTEINS